MGFTDNNKLLFGWLNGLTGKASDQYPKYVSQNLTRFSRIDLEELN